MEDIAEIKAAWLSRWDYLYSPIHGCAYALDPRFIDQKVLGNKEVLDGMKTILNRMLPPEKHPEFMAQLHLYRSLNGPWAEAGVQISMKRLAPCVFWSWYGSSAPELASVALRVLSQVTSTGAAERSWSSYDFIHSKRRNRLTADKACKLVSVFSNLRLVEARKKKGYEQDMVEIASDDE